MPKKSHVPSRIRKRRPVSTTAHSKPKKLWEDPGAVRLLAKGVATFEELFSMSCWRDPSAFRSRQIAPLLERNYISSIGLPGTPLHIYFLTPRGARQHGIRTIKIPLIPRMIKRNYLVLGLITKSELYREQIWRKMQERLGKELKLTKNSMYLSIGELLRQGLIVSRREGGGKKSIYKKTRRGELILKREEKRHTKRKKYIVIDVEEAFNNQRLFERAIQRIKPLDLDIRREDVIREAFERHKTSMSFLKRSLGITGLSEKGRSSSLGYDYEIIQGVRERVEGRTIKGIRKSLDKVNNRMNYLLDIRWERNLFKWENRELTLLPHVVKALQSVLNSRPRSTS